MSENTLPCSNSDFEIKIDNNKVFCDYCRNPLNDLDQSKKQICKTCEKIISTYLKLERVRLDLSQREINAIKLLEINHDIKLPILDQKILNDFSKKNKWGVVIRENKVIGIFLDNHDFYSFPDELYYFSSLKYLSLMNTKLTRIPSRINELQTIEALDLRSNTIEFLPDPITNLQNLKILTLKDNLLRLLPDAIGDMKLEHLDVENNLLYSIPDSFKDLEHLKVLNLFDNQINFKLIKGKMPNYLQKCGIGGNSISKKSIRLLKSVFKGKKCKIYLKRSKSWDKK